MEIESKTKEKLQQIISGISKGDIEDAMGMIGLDLSEVYITSLMNKTKKYCFRK